MPCASGRTSTPAARHARCQSRTIPGSARECLGGHVDAREEAQPGTDVADQRVVGERCERRGERLFQRPAALDQLLALVDVERDVRRRAARGMSGIGRSVAQHRRARAGR